MTIINEIRRRAEHLAAYAESLGVVLTVEQISLQPPAMGHHRTVVDVRPARHLPTEPPKEGKALWR